MNQNKIFILSNKISPAISSFLSSIGYSLHKVDKVEKDYPILFKDFKHDVFFGSKLEYSISKLCDDYPYSKYIIPTDGASPSKQSLKNILSFFYPEKVNLINNDISRSVLDPEKEMDFKNLNNSAVRNFLESEENFIKLFLNFITLEPVYDFRKVAVIDSVN